MKRKINFNFYILGISILLVIVAGCTKNANVDSFAAQKNRFDAPIDNKNIPIGNKEGFRAPDFTVTTSEGNTIKLSEITAKDKPVLVYFMATWCPYCSSDLAVVNRVYPEYKDQVEFVAIDLDLTENAKILQRYKKSKKHDFTLALGNPQVLENYGIRGTTAKFAVSREGVILYTGYGVLDKNYWNVIFKGLAES